MATCWTVPGGFIKNTLQFLTVRSRIQNWNNFRDPFYELCGRETFLAGEYFRQNVSDGYSWIYNEKLWRGPPESEKGRPRTKAIPANIILDYSFACLGNLLSFQSQHFG